ncbi:MAG: thymidine kinase, partial [Bacteroidales bacterium]|nr:thymidine kinase [Bacteroidales bacterium]
TKDEKIVVLGEKDIYEPLCRTCFIRSVNRQG